MILLDTNVVSGFMKPLANPVLTNFAAQYPIKDMYLPSIAMAEVRYGIQCLPIGRRRRDIEADFETFLEMGFSNRIVKFGAACAQGYATVQVTRRQSGRPVSVQDALIGGIALANGAVLATRNISDFDGYGLKLINPWTAS